MATQTLLSQPRPDPFRWRQLLLLILLGLLLFFAGLGALPLVEPDEGRNAEVAREMLAAGDWTTPQFDGLAYLDKPAVFFWLVAASFRAFGISEWAARLPSALLGLATLILVWWFGRRMFGGLPSRAPTQFIGASEGLRAGLILATSPLTIVEARLVSLDMTLTFLVTAAMLGFWLGETVAPRRLWHDVLLFGAMGLAAITKGPVGFLLPLLSIAAYLGWRGRWRELSRLRWGLGVFVFLAVSLPWFVAVSLRNPGFPRYAFWQESLLRFATGQARRPGSVFYYVPVYLAGFFPWSFLLLGVGWQARRRWRQLRDDAQSPVVFLLAWAGAVFIFFTISRSKLPAYILPAIVPSSLLMASAWDASEDASRWLTRGFSALAAVGLLTAAGGWWLPPPLSSRLKTKLHPAVLTLLGPSLVYCGLILLALAFLGRNLAARAKSPVPLNARWRVFALTALIVPLLLLRWRPALRTFALTASSRQLAEAIRSSPEKDLPVYGYYYFRTSLPFYLRRPVGLVTSGGSELTSNYISSHFPALRSATLPGGLPLLVNAAGMAALAEHQSLLVITRNTHVGSLARAVGRLEPMWQGWDYSVWKVPAAPPPRVCALTPKGPPRSRPDLYPYLRRVLQIPVIKIRRAVAAESAQLPRRYI